LPDEDIYPWGNFTTSQPDLQLSVVQIISCKGILRNLELENEKRR